ncbi:MAG: hypothetical protein WBP29_05705 [Candidatus Zixiibacteriota bacterium]
MRDSKDSQNDKGTLGINDPKIKETGKGNDPRTPNPMDEGFVYYED